VTLEDLLEEIVGEVGDPFDAVNPEIQTLADGSILIDGLTLIDARITNAVHCVPPENKPTPVEINTCRDAFLAHRIPAMRQLRAIVALGRIAHESTLRALGHRLAAAPFAHGARHAVGKLTLFDSYHCSRYNTNTGVLTPDMFRQVFKAVRDYLDD